jgi:hypothetical protein
MTPWLEYDMTEDEWREYEDEYANWLDSLRETK